MLARDLLHHLLNDPQLRTTLHPRFGENCLPKGELRRLFKAWETLLSHGSAYPSVAMLAETSGLPESFVRGVSEPVHWVEPQDSLRVISEALVCRNMAHAAERLADSLRDAAGGHVDSIEDLMESVSQRIDRMWGENRRLFKPRRTMRELVHEYLGHLRERAESGDLVEFSTGFDSLDQAFGGWRPGNMAVLGARPGMGKTCLAVNLTLNALAAGRKCLFLSLEMSGHDIIERLLSARGGIGMQRMSQGLLTEREANDLDGAAVFLASAPLVLDDVGALTGEEAARRISAAAQSSGIDFVVVDYVQLMTGRRSDNRNDQIAEISNTLKRAAMESNATVLVLSQLNRVVERRANLRPILSDLRDSGAIEQAADLVLLMYRDDYYEQERSLSPGCAEVAVAKNRYGRQGAVAKLRFDGDLSVFSEWRGD